METKRVIKFSHRYCKFDTPPERVQLLHVFRENAKSLGGEFINYDTTYEEKDGEMGQYALPTGKVLVLLFEGLKDYGELGLMGSFFVFTTIRRWTKEKERYYRENIGKRFEVVMTDE